MPLYSSLFIHHLYLIYMYPFIHRAVAPLTGLALLVASSSCSHRHTHHTEQTRQVSQSEQAQLQHQARHTSTHFDSLTFDVTETITPLPTSADSTTAQPPRSVRHLRGYLTRHHRASDSTHTASLLRDSLQRETLQQTAEQTSAPSSPLPLLPIGLGVALLLFLLPNLRHLYRLFR